jgi:hypothetical protein
MAAAAILISVSHQRSSMHQFITPQNAASWCIGLSEVSTPFSHAKLIHFLIICDYGENGRRETTKQNEIIKEK